MIICCALFLDRQRQQGGNFSQTGRKENRHGIRLAAGTVPVLYILS
ncbi:hypothetical protein HMPREF1250_1154 [Megasphaera vaginalis (ex Srinivasan et al. 2021)]|uniref:Uncharacterized protein n=1 Tax=Megasphaera vaginalis (ex Srinivasan et al. 2021) TaxID=1111454 RepID=U7UEP7_9FIRM|nr:hypothetical protein HMPREF1250_1154 [Megasphaera vaginalis (ex Srinivasan et al. 2021)]